MNSPIIAEHVEPWSPDQLSPDPRNARMHSDHQITQIVNSILEYGFTNPVLADRKGRIIAGHARVLAARKLGLRSVPVIILEHLTEMQKRAYIIADNQLALNAGWDLDTLRRELLALEQESFNLDLVGINDDEFKKLMSELTVQSGNVDEDDVPEVPEKAVAVAGDLWQLGNHQLLCGDSTALDNVNRILCGGRADLIFTDPPYNVSLGNSDKDKRRGRQRRIVNDNLGQHFATFLGRVCTNLLMVAKGAVYICMSSSELHTLRHAFTAAGGHWSTFLVWSKDAFTLGRSDYQHQYEQILYGWKKGADHYWCGARNQGDVWNFDKPRVNDLHPTMKPVELVERAIRNSSQSRDIVLDAFGGAGSTLIACEKSGRHARLIEIEPKYVDVCIRRWQAYTGRQATLTASDCSFADIAQERLETKVRL